jgi:hypothetical protein
MKRLTAVLAIIASMMVLCFDAAAWNTPGHMLSGAIAYQIRRRETPTTIPGVRSLLEKNPWYETRWKAQLEKSQMPSGMKCFSCWPHAGPMTFVPKTARWAIRCGTS